MTDQPDRERALEMARAALAVIEPAEKSLDDAFESGRPWYVAIPNGDVAPMIWDASGDAIVSTMPDGKPYLETPCADLIVACVNVAPAVCRALLASEAEIARLRLEVSGEKGKLPR